MGWSLLCEMPMLAVSCSVSERVRALMSVACKLQYKQYVIAMSVAFRLVQYVSLCMCVFVISLSVVHLTEEHQPVSFSPVFSVRGLRVW